MNIYQALTFILLGALITIGLKIPLKILIKRFRERAPIIKKYWLFVAPYVLLEILAYLVVGLYFNNGVNDEVNYTLIGQISATIFAIFVGYIAFSEFGESKFDKLVESASYALQRREYN